MRRRGRRPGLVGTMARTAVITSTASTVAGKGRPVGKQEQGAEAQGSQEQAAVAQQAQIDAQIQAALGAQAAQQRPKPWRTFPRQIREAARVSLPSSRSSPS